MTWQDFLDDYEGKLTSTELALETGTDLDPAVLQPFVEPDLGVVPDDQIDRLVEVLRRSHELGLRLETAKDTIEREIVKSVKGQPKSPFAETVIPKYFDSAI